MLKLIRSSLFVMLMIMLGCVLVNAHEYVVLTENNPNETVSSGKSVIIYGTSDANWITVQSGADVELVNFPGSNTVSIESDSEGFTVSRSGAVMTFAGEDGTYLKIPATQTPQIIDFTDLAPLTLRIYDGQVMLDDQVISTTTDSIDSKCGAYIAPGVWKEFDCYNLAAIGKTTGDDPFTPSWCLIGGYWQWGRKGPGESEWYGTNTSNFAHGPTGPDKADANWDKIDGWDDDAYADDGAWSDNEKSSNDPCPLGYRVPTLAEWEGVNENENNIQRAEGTWSSDATNYSSGRFFGDDLMLPAAGFRDNSSGRLSDRDGSGYYWSGTEGSGSSNPWVLELNSSSSYVADYYDRRFGFSVRCIAEDGTQQSVWYKDSDGDGYSDGTSLSADDKPDGYYLSTDLTAISGDCDDDDDKVHPGADEICDNFKDDDCDGEIDEDCTVSVWYKDSDGDGYSDGESQRAYDKPGDDYYLSTDLTAIDGDCDDNDDKIHPGAEEICDNDIDDDCNGETDENCGPDSSECGAYIAPGVWKEFDCYNLAAIGKDRGEDPFTPSWRLIGGYWQWGRKGPDESAWYNTNTPNFAYGPTGPGAYQANDGEINGWSVSPAADGAWSDDVKTANDPCPPGYRVPTKAQLRGLDQTNNDIAVGTWSSDATNYDCGRLFGDKLMLPAAGYRDDYHSGSLDYRGSYGFYWSSTEYSGNSNAINAWSLVFRSERTYVANYDRNYGYSVRCIAE